MTGECGADFNLTCDDGGYVQDSSFIDDGNVDGIFPFRFLHSRSCSPM